MEKFLLRKTNGKIFLQFYIGKPREKILLRKTKGKNGVKFSRNFSIKIGGGGSRGFNLK